MSAGAFFLYAIVGIMVFSAAAQVLTYFTSVEYPFVSRFREWILIVFSIAWPVTLPVTIIVVLGWWLLQQLNGAKTSDGE